MNAGFTPGQLALLTAGAFALAALLTGLLRRYALARALLDHPNARSSHQQPTPRGGGLAIVLVFLGTLLWLWQQGGLAAPWALALGGAGALIAAIGFVDDHRPLPAGLRLGVHAAAALWVLACSSASLPWPPGLLLQALSALCLLLYLMWLLNLYNFMDGIDGIAGIEAVSTGLGAALMLWSSGQSEAALPPLLLAAASAGFLCWNLPPARIFMGDVGSAFLGLSFAILSLQAASLAPALGAAWLILLAVFITDASLTLLRRLLRGERVHQAHRRHAYQFAARRHRSHGRVSLSVGAINLGWLLPLALLVAHQRLAALAGLLLAYLPLLALALHYRAGAASEE